LPSNDRLIYEKFVLEEQRLRKLLIDDDSEAINHAYENAVRQTWWEKLTKTNHKDVTYRGVAFVSVKKG